MDNLTHTLTGALLARSGLDRFSERSTLALVVASNLPDADSIAGLFGPLHYLEHHRGITHSLAGIVVQASVLALVVSWRKKGARFGRLAALSALAMLIHLGMDYMNSYGIRPLLPWSGRWFYGDFAFIIDPWMWLLMGAGLYIGWSGRRWPWLLVATGLTSILLAAVFFLDEELPPALLPLWAGGVVATCTLRAATTTSAVRAARWAGVALAVYVAFLQQVQIRQQSRLAAQANAFGVSAKNGSLAALPRPASPFRWTYVVASDERILVGRDGAWEQFETGWRDPRVREALATCGGGAVDRFFRFPGAEVGARGEHVDFWDARYTVRGRAGFGTARIPLRGPSECPSRAAFFE